MGSGITVNHPAAPSSREGVSDGLLQALGGRAMARNTTWNMVGQVVPLLVAAILIPMLIRRLGVDRFGVLALAWTLVGYFGLFDLGLGRALTKVVSEALAGGKEADAAGAVWTASAILMGAGAVFTLALCLVA